MRCIEFEDGEEHTLTPLAYAMGFSNQEVIKNILDVIKDKAILEEVLTTANISLKFKNGAEHDITLLAHATILCNQEAIKNILDVAEKNNMLEKVFASVRKDYLNETSKILEILKNQEQDEKEKTKISGWLDILKKSISSSDDVLTTLKRVVPNWESKDSNSIIGAILYSISKNPQHDDDVVQMLKSIMFKSIMPDCESSEQSSMAESIVPKTEGNITKDTVKTTNKPIIIGSVCGAIAALAVGLGLYFGAALPVLTMIGIAMAAAVLTGLVAGGITYVMSNSSKNLDGANVEQGVSIGSSITA
ncbi:magnesium transporter [Wolbachia pipientis]|uniref:magnesium transporter n=1 Tax=Wolbachia pipientis TaxID=955 RepID=UPI00257261E4|nr:magnesium transporter [Wolbachia pipientis]